MDIISEFENGDVIASIAGYDMPLHAAAPDLLAALEDASAYINKCSYVDRAKWLAIRDIIETAITKAKGN